MPRLANPRFSSSRPASSTSPRLAASLDSCRAFNHPSPNETLNGGSRNSRRRAAHRARRGVAAFGGLDIRVNNAGVVTRGTVLDTIDAEWLRVMDVNVTAPMRCSRAAVHRMVTVGRDSIISIAPDHGVVAGKREAAYCASKGVLVHLQGQWPSTTGRRVLGSIPCVPRMPRRQCWWREFSHG